MLSRYILFAPFMPDEIETIGSLGLDFKAW